MIALTQEKREELIEWIKRHIEHLKQDTRSTYSKNGIISLEIALASLTAESVAWVFDDDLQDLKSGYIGNLAANNVEPNKVHREIDLPIKRLYTDPPVPAIKLPEKLDVGEIHYELTEKYGMDLSFDQLERGVADEVYSLAVKNFNLLNGWGE